MRGYVIANGKPHSCTYSHADACSHACAHACSYAGAHSWAYSIADGGTDHTSL